MKNFTRASLSGVLGRDSSSSSRLNSKASTNTPPQRNRRLVPGGQRRKETVVASLAGKIDRLLALEAALSQMYDALKIPTRIDKEALIEGRNKWLDVADSAGRNDWALGFGFDARQTKILRESLVVEALSVGLLEDYARSTFGENVNIRNTASYILQNRRIVNDLFFENLLAVAAADDPEVKEVLLYSHPIIMHALKNFKKREATFVLSRNNDILKKTAIPTAVRQVTPDKYRTKTYTDILKITEKASPDEVFSRLFDEQKQQAPASILSQRSVGKAASRGNSLLPPQVGSRIGKRTLVLDMDETLVHCIPQMDGSGWIILRRPGVEEFLRTMYDLYEVVVFTAGTQEYADFVLDRLDSQGLITGRLYRDHTSPRTVRMMGEEDTVYFKDMSRLGRPLEKSMIIDNTPANFDLQPDNGIPCETWFDDPTDTGLYDMTPFLTAIVEENYADVRNAIREQRKKGWPWEGIGGSSMVNLQSGYGGRGYGDTVRSVGGRRR